MTRPTELPPDALKVVGGAIQDMAAARLGRAFLPLALLFLMGLGEMLTGGRGWELALGGPLAAGAMLAHGQRVVQQAFGRPRGGWMTLAALAGVVPLALGLYVLGWRGLRLLSDVQGIPGVVAGVFFTLMGIWVLRAWVKLLELGRLAETMVMGEGTGGNQ